MGLEEVVDAVVHVEAMLADGETGVVQESLLAGSRCRCTAGKACAMLGTCRQLRRRSKNNMSVAELSFNAIEWSFQFYLVERQQRRPRTTEIMGLSLQILSVVGCSLMRTLLTGSIVFVLTTAHGYTTISIGRGVILRLDA